MSRGIPNIGDNGVAYGVIALKSLNSDLAQELMFTHGTDVDYQAAYEQAKKEAIDKYNEASAEAEVAANEVDGNMPEQDRQSFIEKYMLDKHGIDTDDCDDAESYAERELEQFSDTCQIDEPTYQGEYQGVKYSLSTLGGAYLLWALSGTVGSCNRQCSPCCPNAGDLDSGFAQDNSLNYQCYVIPNDWLAEPVVQSTLNLGE